MIPATGEVSVTFDVPEAVPALTGCKVLVGTTPGGSEFSSGSVPCGSTSSVVSGLAYGQPYYFRVSSTNSVGTGTSNELNATPVRPAVANLTAAPNQAAMSLNWDDAALLGSDTYDVASCAAPATSPCTSSSPGYIGTTNTGTTSAANYSGLVVGQPYTFTVSYGAPGTALTASVTAAPSPVKCNKGPVSKIVSNLNAALEPVACLVQGLGL